MSSSAPTEVGDRLERLAEHAPLRLDDPDLLWSRGRRRQRSHWAGTAAGLVVLAVLGAVAVPPLIDGTPGRKGMVAVSPDADLLLPDLVRQPGEWEGAFPKAPGRLVAVGIGTRGGWWSSRNAWWGVSAATGESRFLDLPDAVTATDAQPALSADGRLLAYWFTGETTQEPFRTQDASPAVGVAVLDLVTGEVARWDTDTSRGLMMNGLAWAGDVLWWSGGPYGESSTTMGSSAIVVMHTWDLTTDERRELARGTAGWQMSLSSAVPGRDGFVAGARGTRLRQVRGGEVEGKIRTDVGRLQSPALSPGGTRLVALRSPDARNYDTLPLIVGGMGPDGFALSEVGDVGSARLLGWRSEDEVVIETHTEEDMDLVFGASVVDIDTGEVTPMLDFRGNQPRFAADAWSAEVIEAPDAPWAPDPRLFALAMFVAAWVVLKAVQIVRRRRVGT